MPNVGWSQVSWCFSTPDGRWFFGADHFEMVLLVSGMEGQEMSRKLRIMTDFNERTREGHLVVLKVGDKDLEDEMGTLGVKIGDEVILYPNEDDFCVPARLGRGFVDELNEIRLFAIPDYSRIRRRRA